MDAEAILKWAREQPQQDHRSRAVTCSPGLGHWKTCFRPSRTRHWLSGGRARCWVCRSRCFIHLRGFAILSNPCQLAGLSLKWQSLLQRFRFLHLSVGIYRESWASCLGLWSRQPFCSIQGCGLAREQYKCRFWLLCSICSCTNVVI